MFCVQVWGCEFQVVPGSSPGPVIGVLPFFTRSVEQRRLVGTSGAGVVSIASREALAARVCRLVLRVCDLAWCDEALRPDVPGAAGLNV